MRAQWLGLAAAAAAIAIFPVPAAAQPDRNMTNPDLSGVPIGDTSFRGDFRSDFDRRDRRRLRGDGDVFIGQWPQQGDTAWRSNSFNDWWHDRPDRAYPAWVQRNQQTCERMYWGGGGWRC